jgi:OmcA/MtrC family decaheme c-type cytochrome
VKFSDQSNSGNPPNRWLRHAAAVVLAASLAACGGGGGGGTDTAAPTPAPAVPVPTGTAPIKLTAATTAATFATLTPAVPAVAVAINGAPVVSFSVTDGKGNPIIGLGSKSQAATATLASYPNLAFSLAKLVPGTPSKWVNYIVTTVPTKNATTGAITASVPTRPSTDNTGTLVDNGNGTYTYTFYRDITKVKDVVAAATLVAPNVAADLGDLTYAPSAVHRLTIQISGNAPGTGSNTANGATTTPAVVMTSPIDVIYDFIPATGKAVAATDPSRDITATAKCNECHFALGGIAGDTTTDSGALFHGGSRNETKYCVVCHTEQRKYGRVEALTTASGDYVLTKNAAGTTTSAGTYRINDIAVGNFPSLIHKTHFGKMLSKKGYDYAGVEFNEVGYPQDARNCAKCHDGSATSTAKTAQGNNWIEVPNRIACGGCHDAVNFGTGKVTKNGVTTNHFPGPLANDATCATCHTAVNNAIYHVAVTPPNLGSALHVSGGNANSNAAWIASNTSYLPAGAIKVTYDVQSVSRNAAKQPVMVFRMLQNGATVALNNPATSTEIWSNFIGAPSVYFVYAMTQDGIAKPADFNASASSYLRSLWNGKATGAAAGTLTGPDASGYYTATLTGVTIPDTATMLTGGLGFSYNALTALPLTQTNLADYPVKVSTVTGLTAGMPNQTGGLIVIAPNITKVAAGYTARRAIVSDALCNNCHQELGTFTEDAFHAGQRNDGTSCSWCHTPNRASSGWSADSTAFVHAIHAGAKRADKYNWHAVSATQGFWDIKYPGVLKNCESCHLAGTYDFSAAGSAVPAPNNRQYRTVMTGTSTAATFSTSPYVAQAAGTAYGAGYAVAATGTVTEAAGTTLVTSPIATACFACHDSTKVVAGKTESAVDHMKRQGASLYTARTTGLATKEICMDCHSATNDRGLGIKEVHKIK